MNLRVTGHTLSSNAISYLQSQASKHAKYQDQISSGLRIKAASDDPAHYPALLRTRAEAQRVDAYAQTMADATTDLNAGVDALLDVNRVLTRAKQIATEAADASTNKDGHAALANEVDSLINRLMSAANTQLDGNYLFGGTATDTPPFQVATANAQGQPANITYAGSTDRARVLIGPGHTAGTKYVGSAVFQQTGGDAFAALIGLRDELRNPNGAQSSTLNLRLAEVDAAADAIGTTVGDQSAQLASLEAVKIRLADLKLASSSRVSELESTDVAEAVVKLQEQETALQATMAVTAKLLEPSLLDFIR